jgi:hypothetical protein
MRRFLRWLWSLTGPPATKDKAPVIAISDSHAHFCEGCRCFVKVTLWDMETCPHCGSTELKYAVQWMRSEPEQQMRAAARRRRGGTGAVHGGVPKPLLRITANGATPNEAAFGKGEGVPRG